MSVTGFKLVACTFEAIEYPRNGGMIDGLVTVIHDQILLADIRDIIAVGIFGEQMIKRLIFRRTDRFRDRFIPFIAVCKDRIDIENDAAKIEMTMSNNIADIETGVRDGGKVGAFRRSVVRLHNDNLGLLAHNTSRIDLATRLRFAKRAASILPRRL
jgi:hypothetical protein